MRNKGIEGSDGDTYGVVFVQAETGMNNLRSLRVEFGVLGYQMALAEIDLRLDDKETTPGAFIKFTGRVAGIAAGRPHGRQQPIEFGTGIGDQMGHEIAVDLIVRPFYPFAAFSAGGNHELDLAETELRMHRLVHQSGKTLPEKP